MSSSPSELNDPEVTKLVSRHSHFLPLSLSRYKRQWFLTYPRPYGMVDPPGQRIYCKLNTPDTTVDEEYARRHFWLNAHWLSRSRYNPEEDGDKRFMNSPIHILLDSETPVAKLTGRIRTEPSNYHDERGKEIPCYEVEVLIPEEGLLRQCYYCFGWEAEGPMTRWTACGDDTYWCPSCRERGWAASSMSGFSEKMYRDTLLPTFDRHTFSRDSLYY